MDGGRIHIGGSYYPSHYAAAEWERDFALLADHGLTAVRTGELISSWDVFERAPGEVDFSLLDRFFELAAKHGLRVLLGTGACSPPHWLRRAHPDLAVVDRDGVPYPPGAMWSWACINHPAYLAESERYLGQLLERYGGREQLLGWQIHNEPGYPFVPRADRGAADWYDYNPHAVKAFRAWLQAKYGDVAALNEAWAWIPTGIGFADFDEVDAPRRTPAEWGIPNAWLDWRRFAAANWNAFIRRQHEQIKASAPELPTMTNVYGAGVDADGRLGVDCWSLAEQVDAIGYDLYPGTRPGAGPASVFPAWFLDFAASTAKRAGRPLALPELESGPIGGWADGPAHATSPADMQRWALMALARGCRMVLFQGCRAWPRLPLHWGGLLDAHGAPTPGLAAAGGLAAFVAKHAATLAAAQPLPARVRILHGYDSQIFGASTGWPGGMLAAYEPLARLGYAVGFAGAASLAAADLDGCELLLLPNMLLLDPAAAAAIADYVAGGGTALSFPRTGMLDPSCQLWPERPGGLADLLGAAETAVEHLDGSCIALDFAAGGSVELELAAPRLQVQRLRLAAGTKTLAKLADGAPALTVAAHGKGRAVHCALSLDQGGVANAAAVWGRLLAALDVLPDCAAPDGTPPACEARLLATGDDAGLLFIASRAAAATEHALRLHGRSIAKAERLWPHGEVELDGAGGLRARLAAGGATVCKVKLAA
ncbi:MAG: beta-galactosidase [Betaproteobacteria bacterium AqS2]|uniref:beta-galactosidase n=1 Tax=Candidatus Amphirhobacter heronislandensis TaxID=1732024 RepID=A0A930UBQ2_9GAMM|nr:beta-galactosidase [Betaproteobacteria bacterium AqS2]